MKPLYSLAVALGLAACGATMPHGAVPTPGFGIHGERAHVVRVVDGDTIVVSLGGSSRVRLIGIDTPETVKPGAPVQCFGRAASNYTHELLDGEDVILVYDVQRLDPYGRTLAYVYRARDNLFVNLALARDGYATVFTVPPNVAHAEELVRAAREARAAGRGLWGACGTGD